MNKEAEHKTNIIFEDIDDGVFTVDAEWKIIPFNPAAEKITEVAMEEAIGRHCWEVFRAGICERRCCIRRILETREPVLSELSFIVNPHGERIPISISASLLKDKSERIIAGIERFRKLSNNAWACK
jgi:PAS domain S-box-containing protein